MKRATTVIFAVLTGWSLHAIGKDEPAPQKAPQYTHVDGPRAVAMLQPEALKVQPLVVLDVRTADEFAAGHIDGAKQLDYFAADFATQLAKLDKDRAYLLHCRSGRRSGMALEQMKKLGFKKVFHLDGGIAAWQKAGGTPVPKAPAKKD